MIEDIIKCPKCGEIIKLSEAISHDIEIAIKSKYDEENKKYLQEEKKKLETKLKQKAEESIKVEVEDLIEQLNEKNKKLEIFQSKELELRKIERQLKEKEENINKVLEERGRELKSKITSEKKMIEEKAKKEALEEQKVEIVDLKEQLNEKTEKLKLSQEQELDLRKKQRELEEKEKIFELEITRKIDCERNEIREKVSKEIEENHRLKGAEKDKQLADMRKQIEELKRKSEQGSQQTQGEVLELELEHLLKSKFLFDEIEPVPKGKKGADVIQTVKTRSNHICGKILWETKRTKAWSNSWVAKIKDDQREAKANISVIVSETLPKGFQYFQQIDSVWVTEISLAMSLASALRVVLVQEARAYDIQTGKEEKMEIVYNYLTGSEFKNRIQAIMEPFILMKKDLDTEKRAMEKIWAKREKQIERVMRNIAGIRGDIEGIVQVPLPVVKILELPSGDE